MHKATNTQTRASAGEERPCHIIKITHRGARTHDHKVKRLALYRVSQAGCCAMALYEVECLLNCIAFCNSLLRFKYRGFFRSSSRTLTKPIVQR